MRQRRANLEKLHAIKARRRDYEQIIKRILSTADSRQVIVALIEIPIRVERNESTESQKCQEFRATYFSLQPGIICLSDYEVHSPTP